MEDLERKKEILMAIKSALANINLDEDKDIELSDINIDSIEDIIEGCFDGVGRLSYKR